MLQTWEAALGVEPAVAHLLALPPPPFAGGGLGAASLS
jgi:hypothetical protein